MILQPLGLQPTGYHDGCLSFDIQRAYKGQLWIEADGDRKLFNNGMTFVLIAGDTVRVPENYGCRPGNQGCPTNALSHVRA